MKKHFIIFFGVLFLLISSISFAAPVGKITYVEGRVDVMKTGKNVASSVKLEILSI